MKNPRKQKTPPWVWLISTFFSGIIGITFAVFFAIPSFYGLWKTRESVQVPAMIKKWDLIVSSGSAKSAGSAYVKAEYDYRYNGKDYKGTRVSLFGYESEVYKEHSENTETLCFIDPNDPAYSVIDRRFYILRLLFFIVIPTFLLFICYGSIVAFCRKQT